MSDKDRLNAYLNQLVMLGEVARDYTVAGECHAAEEVNQTIENVKRLVVILFDK